jgi:multicomponent Na+:H+ antiporter subunit D
VYALIPLPIIVPLLAAGLSIVLGRHRQAQRVVSIAALATIIGASVALVVAVDDSGVEVTQAGGWPVPIGITLIVDRLSAIMLLVSSTMLAAVLVFSIG